MAGGLLRQWVAALVANLSVFVVGTALGWPSPVLHSIENTGVPMNLTHTQAAFMVSVLYIGNIASPVPSGALMDIIGRRATIQLLTTLPIVSWLIAYFATLPLHLYLARFLGGTWLGAVNTVVPSYIAEISKAKARGALSTLFQLMTNAGVLFAFVIGPELSYHNFIYILGAVPIVFFLLVSLIPESPYWLLKRGKNQKAIKSLCWLRNKKADEIKEELAEIEESITRDSRRASTYLDLFASKGNRKALLIVEMLAITQRASGISALMAYLSTTLPEEGPLDPNSSVILIGCSLVFSVFPSTFLVDRSGRRPLLLFSTLGSAVSMLVAAVWFFLHYETQVNVRGIAWVPLAALISYSLFFCLGLGPLATTLQGEMFSTSAKARASGITSIVLALTSFAMNMIFFKVADTFGMYVNYLLFTLSCIISAVFVSLCVVETKGKSLNQIQKELDSSNQKQQQLI